MVVADFAKKLLALAQVLYLWTGQLAMLDRGQREKVARYSDEIAETLARASRSAALLIANMDNETARRDLLRELGRIAGYLTTIIDVLEHHLDGRKLAGVKRRLEKLRPLTVSPNPQGPIARAKLQRRLDLLTTAEGYFRALADSLRA